MGEITAGQLSQLVAGRHFPLCMTVMYERLTNEHHLKHWGLQQFTLFLKAVGLPLEQAMLFFRHQFAPRWAQCNTRRVGLGWVVSPLCGFEHACMLYCRCCIRQPAAL
jgi:DNA primase large subunit